MAVVGLLLLVVAVSPLMLFRVACSGLGGGVQQQLVLVVVGGYPER